jgi:drug/metabolite transporter (DMT)-like permease
MKTSPLLVNGMLVLVAFLWGAGFAPQRLGMESLDAMAFNAWRFGFGALTLIPVFFLMRLKFSEFMQPQAILGALVLGILLSAGAGLQQMSVGMTKLANVAFITGFYVILVPVLGLFVAHRYPMITWVGGIFALIGLALLSGFTGELSLTDVGLQGDLLALIGALFWALHLLAITYYVARYNQFVLAFYQFVFCALISAGVSIGFEERVIPTDNMGYVWALLNGIIVVGIAYTLQVIVLKQAKPFVAAVIFSLESVFGALVGYWFFNEVLGLYGLAGALLMLFGCILSQWPENKKDKPQPHTLV